MLTPRRSGLFLSFLFLALVCLPGGSVLADPPAGGPYVLKLQITSTTRPAYGTVEAEARWSDGDGGYVAASRGHRYVFGPGPATTQRSYCDTGMSGTVDGAATLNTYVQGAQYELQGSELSDGEYTFLDVEDVDYGELTDPDRFVLCILEGFGFTGIIYWICSLAGAVLPGLFRDMVRVVGDDEI